MENGDINVKVVGYCLKLVHENAYADGINPLHFNFRYRYVRGNTPPDHVYLFKTIPEVLKAIDTDVNTNRHSRVPMTIVRVVETSVTTTSLREEDL